MENSNGDYEQKPLTLIINELVQGKELVKQLRSHLDKSSSSTTGEYLIEMALTSFDKALWMINQFGSSSSSDNNNNSIPQSVGGTNINSPNSAGSTGSPQSDDSGHGGDMYKKRKTIPQWSKQVKVSSDTGFEGPLEDGYSWRKYGQKAIHGATYPRGYYRCTYLHSQGCLARKQVQRSTNPSIFNVTYRGKHTCIQTSHLMQASQSPSKQTFQNQEYPYQYQDQKPSKEVVILNFGTGLSIKTEDLDTQELTINPSSFSFPSTSNATGGCMKIATTSCSTDHDTLSPLRKRGKSPLVGNYSPAFLSPTPSESNYFSECQQAMNNKAELNEIGVVSAATSGSSSPIMDMQADFQLDNDPFDFESNFFPFDIRDFLS